MLRRKSIRSNKTWCSEVADLNEIFDERSGEMERSG